MMTKKEVLVALEFLDAVELLDEAFCNMDPEDGGGEMYERYAKAKAQFVKTFGRVMGGI